MLNARQDMVQSVTRHLSKKGRLHIQILVVPHRDVDTHPTWVSPSRHDDGAPAQCGQRFVRANWHVVQMCVDAVAVSVKSS